jgi:hypothetical protein
MPAALSALVMDDENLSELEALLAKFNLFRVLKADRNELRHSNMLAWLLTPSEAHGLDEQFLRRWLMEVTHSASASDSPAGGNLSPVWIDAADISEIRVRREWQSLDVIVEFTASVSGRREHWVVAIENKVNAQQGQLQLEGYRKTVARQFRHANQTIFIFLTKNEEQPADPYWVTSTYADVLRALERCVAARRDTIGREPLFLIEQYLELLRDDFMEDTQAVELARAIYKRHAAAIDFIFECKIDPIFELSNRLEKRLTSNMQELGIVMSRSGKGRLRFLPVAWETKSNSGGRAWGEDSHYMVLELDLYTKTVELNAVAGDAPEDWTDLVWKHCANPPLQRSQKAKPRRFLKAYRGRSMIHINGFPDHDLDAAEQQIFDWTAEHMKSENFRNAKEILTKLLEKLT